MLSPFKPYHIQKGAHIGLPHIGLPHSGRGFQLGGNSWTSLRRSHRYGAVVVVVVVVVVVTVAVVVVVGVVVFLGMGGCMGGWVGWGGAWRVVGWWLVQKGLVSVNIFIWLQKGVSE